MAIYDAPARFFDMAWRDELNWSAARGLLYEDMVLSPSERESFSDRLKDRFGGDNPLVRSFVGIVTNPIFLASAVFAPGASVALTAGRNRIMSSADKLLPWASGNRFGVIGKLLENFGALGPTTVLRNTKSEAVLHATARSQQKLLDEFSSPLEAAQEAFARRLGIKPGQFISKHNKAYLNADQVEQVGRWEALAWIHLNGRDKVSKTYILSKKGKVVEHTLQPLITGRSAIDRIRDDFGQEGVDLVNGMRTSLNKRKVRLFAKEELQDVIDDITDVNQISLERLERLRTAIPQMRGMGTDELRRALSDMTGSVINSNVDDVGAEGLLRLLSGDYFPRNRYDIISPTGKHVPMDSEAAEAIRRTAAGAVAPGRARTSPQGVFAPSDLQDLHRAVNGEVTDEFTDLYNKGLAAVKRGEKADLVEDIIVQRIDTSQSVLKYDRQSSALKHLYLDPIDEATIKAAQETGTEIYMKEGLLQNNAWALAEDYNKIVKEGGDMYAAKTISHYVMPTIAGKWTAEGGLQFNAFLNMKRIANQVIAEGPLGKLIESAGYTGFRERAKQYLAAEHGLDEAATKLLYRQQNDSAMLSRYLYTTHLGFNLSSVLLNATQPFILGSTHIGNRNVIAGYKAALQEMGGYLAERSRLAAKGQLKLHRHEHMAIIKKHFPHHELTDITPEAMEALDAIAFRSPRTHDTAFGKLSDASLFAFSKVEWLNRSVIFHGTRKAYQKAGRLSDDLGDALNNINFRRDVKELVDETQFAANKGNTPLIFQTNTKELSPVVGGLFNNSLMRQFLSFRLRSATAVFGPFSRQVAGGRRKFLGREFDAGGFAPLIDFTRIAGTSAVIYELGKEFLKVDLSEKLGVAATLDIVPFTSNRYDAYVPPVMDIPFQTFSAVASADYDLLRRSVARAIPSGVALSRLFGAAPSVPGAIIQREYADWNEKTPDGQVPIKNKQTGQVIRYANAMEIISRGTGLDLERWNSEKQLNRYIVAQSQEMRQLKAKASAAIASGDMTRYNKLRELFEKRFKIPLTLTQNDVKRKADQLSMPERERFLQLLPDNAESQMREYINRKSPGGASPAQQAAQQQDQAYRPF
jgi:hypothetical protein